VPSVITDGEGSREFGCENGSLGGAMRAGGRVGHAGGEREECGCIAS
jgi:hypothetical protein